MISKAACSPSLTRCSGSNPPRQCKGTTTSSLDCGTTARARDSSDMLYGLPAALHFTAHSFKTAAGLRHSTTLQERPGMLQKKQKTPTGCNARRGDEAHLQSEFSNRGWALFIAKVGCKTTHTKSLKIPVISLPGFLWIFRNCRIMIF